MEERKPNGSGHAAVPHRFTVGDCVRHAARPEWGQGTVEVVVAITHQGHSAQRLTIKFADHGRLTVNTAVARIIPAGQFRPDARSDEPAALVKPDPMQALTRLPEAMDDPLASPLRRLRESLTWYRFGDDARGMIDWACARTGLTDPLQELDRRDLERTYLDFIAQRDAHVRRLILELTRTQPTELRELFEQQRPAIRRKITQLLSRRS